MTTEKPPKIRRQHLAFLVKLIKEHGPLSQRELSELSGLSVVTISKLIPQLMVTNEIQEFSDSVVTGGRRAVSYEFNGQRQLLLVAQLIEKEGHLVFMFYICDLSGKILVTKEELGSSMSWIGLKDYLKKMLKKYPKVKGIIWGIPGVEIQGVLRMLDYPPLLHVNLRSELIRELGIVVAVENDINLAALGYSSGTTVRSGALVGIYYPRDFPPGAGIILNGKIVKGHNGLAGEIKYLPLKAEWEKASLSEIDILTNLTEVVQTMISLYDPSEIVVYARNNQINAADLLVIKAEMAEVFPFIELPTVTLSNDFSANYLQGLIKQGLKLVTSTNTEELTND